MMKAILVFFALPALFFGDGVNPSPFGYSSLQSFTAASQALIPGAEPGQAPVDAFGMPAGTETSSEIVYDGEQASNGHFVGGIYSETTEKYSVTTWTFDTPVYGFGGDWHLDAGGSGLEIYGDGFSYFLSSAPSAAFDGFWGFISDKPIDSVEIGSGSEQPGAGFSQNYTLGDVEIVTPTPEPSTLSLSGLIVMFAGSVIWAKKRRMNLAGSISEEAGSAS